MKNYIKALTFILLVNVIPCMAMEQDDAMALENQSNTESTIAGLPNEIWAMIFCSIYFDKDALNDCKDIFEALNYLKTDYKEKLSLYSKNIRLTCKTFNYVNKNLKLIQQLKEFYRSILTEKFLELRDGGLYPKNDTWGLYPDIDKQIARFLATGGDSILLANTLSQLCFLNKSEIIALLLFYGANVNARDEGGKTALHMAVILNTYKTNIKGVIEILLAHGADVNTQDKDDNTPLHAAVYMHYNGHDMKEIIEMLLARDANVNIPNKWGSTVIDIAKNDITVLLKSSESYLKKHQSWSCTLS